MSLGDAHISLLDRACDAARDRRTLAMIRQGYARLAVNLAYNVVVTLERGAPLADWLEACRERALDGAVACETALFADKQIIFRPKRTR